jgi:hypothetical protein
MANERYRQRLARLGCEHRLPAIDGFPDEPWRLIGLKRFQWFKAPLERRVLINHILLAQTLNLAADEDDLPVAMYCLDYPKKPDDPIVLYRTSGAGNPLKNPTWQSFFAWLDALDRGPGRVREEQHKSEVRDVLNAHRSRVVVVLPTLPHGHPLGPTGSRTLGYFGGNKSSRLKQPRKINLPWGYHFESPKPPLPPDVQKQNREFDNRRRQFNRIRANGGKRRPAHRPRTITVDKESMVLELLASGLGVKRVAKMAGIGVSGVQRIKREGTASRPTKD